MNTQTKTANCKTTTTKPTTAQTNTVVEQVTKAVNMMQRKGRLTTNDCIGGEYGNDVETVLSGAAGMTILLLRAAEGTLGDTGTLVLNYKLSGEPGTSSRTVVFDGTLASGTAKGEG